MRVHLPSRSNHQRKGGLIMSDIQLATDPYNLIISGVGGQGNVLASRIVGNMLSQHDLLVTIGETFGGTQRGGSVMSHLRISADSTHSPQIPFGTAHVILALEPTEAVRVIKDYGNPDTLVISNTRPIHPVQVISGELKYPALDDVKSWTRELTRQAWFIPATDTAMELGAAILGNIIMIGALAEINVLPLTRDDLKKYLEEHMKPDKVEANLIAFDTGRRLIANGTGKAD
jgi:indolepyruvate ferredoxin oxidoreductase beta subunit